MTFPRRAGIGDGPQPFETMSQNLRYAVERCRYNGLAMISVEIDALEQLLDAFDRDAAGPKPGVGLRGINGGVIDG